MNIEHITAYQLKEILERPAIPIIEIATRTNHPSATNRQPSLSPVYEREMVTSHDLVKMIETLGSKIHRFADKVEIALQELDK